MYKYNKPTTTSLNVNKGYIGERLETKVKRITTNREPIKDGAPPIFTDRADGVMPDYDIRTDRWEYALDAQSKVAATKAAMRLGAAAKAGMEEEAKTETPANPDTPQA